MVEETIVPEAALPVAGFKAHLRLGSGFAEDSLQDVVLVGFLRAAMAAIEGRTGRLLLERSLVWQTEGWRQPDRVTLPVAPVSAVTAFEVVDGAGVAVAVDPAVWRLATGGQSGTVVATTGALPVIPANGHARIALVAGYGPTWADVPADLAQAMLMLAAHYYEYRSDTALGAGCMPFGVTALIERYRQVRLTLGGLA